MTDGPIHAYRRLLAGGEIKPDTNQELAAEKLQSLHAALKSYEPTMGVGADATEDDPTITRCIGFTKRWNFRHLKVINLFAWRATDSTELRNANVIDSENIRTLLNEVDAHDRVVFAWGAGLKHAKGNLWVAEYAARIFFDAQCFGVNRDGTPKHPLYLKANTQLEKWTW